MTPEEFIQACEIGPDMLGTMKMLLVGDGKWTEEEWDRVVKANKAKYDRRLKKIDENLEGYYKAAGLSK